MCVQVYVDMHVGVHVCTGTCAHGGHMYVQVYLHMHVGAYVCTGAHACGCTRVSGACAAVCMLNTEVDTGCLP